jgi:RHS repeat-associated protein
MPGAPGYTYDAEGRRASKNAYTYLYDLAGHAVAELNGGTWDRSEVYAAGRHLATYSGSTTYFPHVDWLGTERVRTNTAGNIVETCTSLPFGDGQSCTGTDVSPNHFTGKQRDTETNLDDFPARYYSSTEGRWLSPDWSAVPVAIPYASLYNPQTLNLYDYVGDDPTNHADPDGHLLAGSDGGDGSGDDSSGASTSDPTKTKAQPQNVINVSSISGTTVEHQDGSITNVATTTTATFSTAKNNAGQFLGATSETVTSQIPANINDPVKNTTTGLHAISFAQATQAMGADKMAAGVAAALPSFATQFGRATAQDARAHPLKYIFAAGEIGLIFTPLPEAYATIEGMHEVKAVIDTGLAAGDLSYELTGK